MDPLCNLIIEENRKHKSKKIDLGNCNLNSIPKEIFDFYWLEEINLSSEYDEYFPNIDKWVRYKSNNIGEENKISFIPIEISNLQSLKKLFITGNKNNPYLISDLSPLRTLSSLRWLELSYNSITDISILNNLTNLIGLGLDHNLIHDISSLKNLKSLKSLHLFNNKIKYLDPLKDLKELMWLGLSNNQIDEVSSLNNLTKLIGLYLGHNKIIDISPLNKIIQKGITVSIPFKIDHLIIGNNPISNPPIHIIKRGNTEILNYFSQKNKQGESNIYEAKLIIVGEAGAGKTTLMKKLLDPLYKLPETNMEEEGSTVGINIHEGWKFENPDNPKVVFSTNIWDFGGQVIQYMTHQFFLTPSALYVLVADDRKQLTQFSYWFKVIHLLAMSKNQPMSPILVVLNENKHKSITNFDLYFWRKEYPDTKILLREVDLSKTTDRYTLLRKTIQEMLVRLPHVGIPVPAKWEEIRKELQVKSIMHEHINLSEFSNICEKYRIQKESEQLLISYSFHILGNILHFQDYRTLSDFIILNPQWAVDAVYSVLKDKNIKNNKGIFTKEEFFSILQDNYTLDEKYKLLNLMLKDHFDLCYATSNHQYIAPQLLPSIQPKYIWENESILSFRFKYPFMPYGILTRLIVRLNELIQNNLVWRNGVIFQEYGCQAQVLEREDTKDGLNVIDIEVNGNILERKFLLRKIREEIDKLHAYFPNISVEKLIRCTCLDCINSKKPTYFEYETLIRAQYKGIKTLKCNTEFNDISVQNLLEGVYDEEELILSSEEILERRLQSTELKINIEGDLHMEEYTKNNTIQATGSNIMMNSDHSSQSIKNSLDLNDIFNQILTESQSNPEITKSEYIKIQESIEEIKRELLLDSPNKNLIENALSNLANIASISAFVTQVSALLA